MSPSAGVAAWRTPAKRRGEGGRRPCSQARRHCCSACISRVFFLWSIHGDPRRATPLTVSRYAYYYGGEPHIRRHLLSSALALQ